MLICHLMNVSQNGDIVLSGGGLNGCDGCLLGKMALDEPGCVMEGEVAHSSLAAITHMF